MDTKEKKITVGCTVYMSSKSGCIGYGNIQCVSSVCEPLGEIGLYGHNQYYKDYDIREIVSWPIEKEEMENHSTLRVIEVLEGFYEKWKWVNTDAYNDLKPILEHFRASVNNPDDLKNVLNKNENLEG